MEKTTNAIIGVKSAQDQIITTTDLYGEYCRPKLIDLLDCVQLNITYTKARGNSLFCNKVKGDALVETEILDFAGGYGTNVLGHNNPELKNTLIEALTNDIPNMVQCSNRALSGKLAQRLNDLIPNKSKYLCNFANSGTESVEAALKHAYKNRAEQIQRKYETIHSTLKNLSNKINIEKLSLQLPDEYATIEALITSLQAKNKEELECFLTKPVIAAFKSAFHGKTTSSLKVTFNKTFRENYERMSAIKPIFMDVRHPVQLQDIISEYIIEFAYPEIVENKLVIKKWSIPRVFAFILEVIQGEGGINIVSDDVLQELAEIHPVINVPYIVDEIQTGCGRTGTFFAYEQTPLRNIEPEYIVLSKALGGGLCKIGAALIHEKEYDPEFGLAHTSTFCEDDASAAVALNVIEKLTQNNNHLMREAEIKGMLIVNELEKLRTKYPQIIKDIRGRGLMVGIEFSELPDFGPFFRYAGQQGFITLLISSYVFHYHNIRILSPLTTMFKGNPGKKRRPVIRIQPSIYISEREIIRLTDALDEVLNIITHNNEYLLMAHLFSTPLSEKERKNPQQIPIKNPLVEPRNDFDSRIGFIVHITELRHLMDYYLTSFEHYEYKKRDFIKWWDKLSRFLDPDLMHRAYIKSNNTVIEANIICVPYLPKFMIRTYAEGKNANGTNLKHKQLLLEMQDKIQDAVTKAMDMGTKRVPIKIVGLGAYNSIVTENGLALSDIEVPLTTGNAFTTALMYMGIKKAITLCKDNSEDITASIVGASGNIGSAISCLLCSNVSKINLIGRDKVLSYQKLAATRELCLSVILESIRVYLKNRQNAGSVELRGIAKIIYNGILKPYQDKQNISSNSEVFAILQAINGDQSVPKQLGKTLDKLINTFYNTSENPLIEVADYSVMLDSDIVAIATNSSDAWLVEPKQIKKGAIVCCASVPSNLSESFKDHTDDYFVFDGGYALLPDNSEINFVGMPKEGNSFGCLAETLILGFEEYPGSFARGDISLNLIVKIMELSEKHNFSLGKFQLGDEIHRMKY
jgi:acetylornithine/succinyldiaminopimelate/putrescine aminotransferase/predicted amino acid dehydrogenase